jgi:hypothetical protein
MNKKVISIVVLLSMLVSNMFILSGCKKAGKKHGEVVNISVAELQQKCDVEIYQHEPSGTEPGSHGGDVIEYKSYFINYSESRLYVYEKEQIVRAIAEGEKNPEPKTVVKVYDVDKKKMKELKEFIESENTKPDGGTTYTIAKKGIAESEIAHTAKFESLIKDIIK